MVELKMIPKNLKPHDEEHGYPIYNIDGVDFIAEQYFCDDDGNPVLKVCMGSCEDCLHEGCNSCIYGSNQHLDRRYFYNHNTPWKKKTYTAQTKATDLVSCKALIYALEQHLIGENPSKEFCANLIIKIWKFHGCTPVEELDKEMFTNSEISIMRIANSYAGALAKFYFSNEDFETVMNSLSPNEQIEVLIHKLNKHWPGMVRGDIYATNQSIAYAIMLRDIFSDNKLTPSPDETLVLNRITFKMKDGVKND